MPSRLPNLVETRLRRYDIDPAAIAKELKAMAPVARAQTADRSVLGAVTDVAFTLTYYLTGTWGDDDLTAVEESLADTPCRTSGPSGRVIFPDRKAPELLHRAWTGDA